MNLAHSLPGFEHVNKFFDSKSNNTIAKLQPGEFYVTEGDEFITTTLGSCIAACITDKNIGVGGMNHFMLPIKASQCNGNSNELVTRYGTYAMEHLINEIFKYGGSRRNLEIKIFGGGKINSSMSAVGQKNIIFVKKFLCDEGYTVTSEDLGDIYPRKIKYHPRTGKVLLKRLPSILCEEIAKREESLQFANEVPDEGGEIDLF